MKKTLIIIVHVVIGVLAGAALGFLLPFGIAQISPENGPALSFVPILTVPAGAILGVIIGVIAAVMKIRRESVIEDLLENRNH